MTQSKFFDWRIALWILLSWFECSPNNLSNSLSCGVRILFFGMEFIKSFFAIIFNASASKTIGELAFSTIDFSKLKVSSWVPMPGPIPIAVK